MQLKGTSYYLIDDKIHLMEDSFSNEPSFAVNQSDRKLLEDINILVVDDNPINLTVADKTLAKFGGTSFKCLSAEESLTVFKSTPIQLILMDLHMPGIDGFAATKLIRETEEYKNNPVPILAYTTYSYNDVKAEIEDCGMSGYIGKPFTHIQVIDTILEVVGIQK
ncbi:response regulator [uncultured Roseivirga sp.]|uniref:response regulator n=1 Tax=uncultured Roseivirga sp. TaxID=543088 RepID=UPI0030DD8C5E